MNPINSAISFAAVREWNWFGEEPTPVAVDVNPLGLPVAFAETTAMQPGAVQSVVRCFTVGPIWLLSQHPLYFFLFGIWFLILWSLFGGAILPNCCSARRPR